jgi:hypothetical protein
VVLAPGGLAPPEPKFRRKRVWRKKKRVVCEGKPERLRLAQLHPLFLLSIRLFSLSARFA